MTKTIPREFHFDLENRLKGLMIFRVIIYTSILVSFYFFQFFYAVEASPLKWLLLIITLSYVLTIIYSLSIHRVRNKPRFAYIQLYGDIFLISGIVFITGAIASPFSFLYIISILAGAIILQLRGALYIASGASIFYGLLITFHLYGVFVPPGFASEEIVEEYILYRLLSNIGGFYLIALLSGSLAKSLHQTGKELLERQQHLARLQELHDNVIRSINVGLMITDRTGHIITVNDAALNLLNASRTPLKEHIRDYIKRKEVEETLSLLPQSRLPYPRIEQELGIGKKYRVLSISFSFWRGDEGKIKGLVILFEDITTQKELLQRIKIKDRLAAVGELSAGLAHEIRNPLASMGGAVQMLSSTRGKTDKTEQKLLSIIEREAKRLNSIVTEFLQFASPKKPQRVPVKVKDLMEDVINLAKQDTRFKQHQTKITIDVPPELTFPLDKETITQLLWNMCSNALDAINEKDDGKGIIEWSGRISEKKELVLTFKDNGCGIKEEIQGKIFSPFFTTKGSGSGLGLSIIHNIVKDHGGDIFPRNNPKGGSAFIVTLPSCEAEEKEKRSKEAEEAQ